MNKPKYICSQNNPDDSTTRDIIYDGLHQFNIQALGQKSKNMLLVVKDDEGNVCGGLDARMMPDSMYIAVVWLSENIRGQGYGTQLMEMAEQAARDHGCENIIVDTYRFQAIPFYENLGYVRIATVEKMLLGHDRVYLKKELSV